MSFPSKEIVMQIKEEYPPNTRVKLIKMKDPYRDIPPGTQGIVTHVDDTGTIFVSWDCGSSLGVVYGVDSVKIVESRLYGFKRRSKDDNFHKDDMNESLCAELFADERIMLIVNKISEKYNESFIWFNFHKGIHDTYMLLDYFDKTAECSGIEIMFDIRNGVWKVTFCGAYKEDTDDEMSFIMDWLLDEQPAEIIADEVLELIRVYMEQGVAGMQNKK
jgi:hypothetical protein